MQGQARDPCKLHRPLSLRLQQEAAVRKWLPAACVFEAETEAGGPEGALAAGGQRHQRQRNTAWQPRARGTR